MTIASTCPSLPGVLRCGPQALRRYPIDARGSSLWRRDAATPTSRPTRVYVRSRPAVTDYPDDWRDLPTGEPEILSHRT